MTTPTPPEDQHGADAAAPAITGESKLHLCVPGRCQAPTAMNLGCDLLGCQKVRMLAQWREALERATDQLGLRKEEL